jgi:hypothetical protein
VEYVTTVCNFGLICALDWTQTDDTVLSLWLIILFLHFLLVHYVLHRRPIMSLLDFTHYKGRKEPLHLFLT